jgi:hypothetical protein
VKHQVFVVQIPEEMNEHAMQTEEYLFMTEIFSVDERYK